MPDNESKPVVVNVKTDTDFAKAALVVCIFLAIVLFMGDPDLLDVLISYLLRA